MNAAEKLHDEYQRKLKLLQETCPHEKRSDWIEEWWAPGYSTDRKVKVCANCNKVLQAKRCCQICQQEFPEEELQTGDGRSLPFGSKYCAACYRAELSVVQETKADLSRDV
jgi:hypothetical protein